MEIPYPLHTRTFPLTETWDVPDAVDGAEPAGLPGARGAERDARRRGAARDLQGDHGHRRPEPG